MSMTVNVGHRHRCQAFFSTQLFLYCTPKRLHFDQYLLEPRAGDNEKKLNKHHPTEQYAHVFYHMMSEIDA